MSDFNMNKYLGDKQAMGEVSAGSQNNQVHV